MHISVQCPQCRHRSDASAEFVGRKVRCHACGGTFVLTAPTKTIASGAKPPVPPPGPPKSPISVAERAAERPIEAEVVSDPIDDLLPELPRRSVAPPEPLAANSYAQQRQAPVRPPRNPTQRVRVPGGRWIFLVLAVLMPILKFGLPYILPHLTRASSLLPGEPYALDDATLRSRAADETTDATFPDRPAFKPSGDVVVRGDAKIAVPGRLPGFDGQLQIYEPAGKHAARSLPCVLTTAAGGTLLQGPGPPTAVDESMWLPYVQAGFVVVAFRQDGGLDALKASEAELEKSGTEFFKAQAGLVNARNALLFTLARLDEVDPERIYVVGHSSAGTMALLWAEHEVRIHGCAVYGAVVDGGRFYERLLNQANHKISPVLQEVIVRTSPSTHASKLDCPLFLWQAEGDLVADVADTRRIADQFTSAGKKVQLVTIPQGDHHQSVTAEGLPAAVRWLQDLDDPQGAATRRENREKEAQARQVVAQREADERNAAAAAGRLDTLSQQWVPQAERLVETLSKIQDANTVTRALVSRAQQNAEITAMQARTLVTTAESLVAHADPTEVELISPAAREQLLAVNEKLLAERDRLRDLGTSEINRGGLLLQLEACALPAWLLEGRVPTAAEEAAADRLTDRLESVVTGGATRRDFREDAEWARRLRRPRDAVQLTYAALLLDDDASWMKSVRWCPALGKPVVLLEWAYGAELNGFPGTTPANLRAPNGTPSSRDRASDFWLGNQLKSVSGEIGQWLAEGLQSRVDDGSFGDWGEDVHHGAFDHRGITLLEFAPVDRLIVDARSQGADVLLALRLTMSRGSAGTPTTNLVVELHRVDGGRVVPESADPQDASGGTRLWESKPISSARLQTARRQGKPAGADFAVEVIQFIDEQIVLVEVPALKADEVERRVQAIAASAASQPLKALLEVRYLHVKKLLSDAQARELAVTILGAEKARLWTSEDFEQRRQAIEPLVPKGR